MLIEYPDVTERQRALAGLIGVEDRVWVQVEGCPRVYAIADEDLERENDEKTSSVHFLRFELDRGDEAGARGRRRDPDGGGPSALPGDRRRAPGAGAGVAAARPGGG